MPPWPEHDCETYTWCQRILTPVIVCNIKDRGTTVTLTTAAVKKIDSSKSKFKESSSGEDLSFENHGSRHERKEHEN